MDFLKFKALFSVVTVHQRRMTPPGVRDNQTISFIGASGFIYHNNFSGGLIRVVMDSYPKNGLLESYITNLQFIDLYSTYI